MACGRPVIGTDAGGTKEYIEHGVSGLIIPACDTNALARGLH
jgi:glycosyltransferase involved in cell wall biosynthesis